MSTLECTALRVGPGMSGKSPRKKTTNVQNVVSARHDNKNSDDVRLKSIEANLQANMREGMQQMQRSMEDFANRLAQRFEKLEVDNKANRNRSRSPSPKSNKIQCFRCRENHYIRDCPYPADYQGNSSMRNDSRRGSPPPSPQGPKKSVSFADKSEDLNE